MVRRVVEGRRDAENAIRSASARFSENVFDRPNETDTPLLEAVLAETAKHLERRGLQLTPERWAAFVTAVYSLAALDQGNCEDGVARVIARTAARRKRPICSETWRSGNGSLPSGGCPRGDLCRYGGPICFAFRNTATAGTTAGAAPFPSVCPGRDRRQTAGCSWPVAPDRRMSCS